MIAKYCVQQFCFLSLIATIVAMIGKNKMFLYLNLLYVYILSKVFGNFCETFGNFFYNFGRELFDNLNFMLNLVRFLVTLPSVWPSIHFLFVCLFVPLCVNLIVTFDLINGLLGGEANLRYNNAHDSRTLWTVQAHTFQYYKTIKTSKTLNSLIIWTYFGHFLDLEFQAKIYLQSVPSHNAKKTMTDDLENLRQKKTSKFLFYQLHFIVFVWSA